MGAGPTPDIAWDVAMETVASSGASAAPSSPGVPNRAGGEGRARLRAALHGSQQFQAPAWGTDRFGLADVWVLRALEGLPGVETACSTYEFVEQGTGWAARERNLHHEMESRGIQVRRASVVVWCGGGGRLCHAVMCGVRCSAPCRLLHRALPVVHRAVSFVHSAHRKSHVRADAAGDGAASRSVVAKLCAAADGA